MLGKAINEFCINSHILLNQQTIISRNATYSDAKEQSFTSFSYSIATKLHSNVTHTAVSTKVVQLKSQKRTRQYRKAWWVVVVQCCIVKFTSFQPPAMQGGAMNTCLHVLKETMDSELLTCLFKIYWVFPRLPFGIVAYAFTLSMGNLCRNSCISMSARRVSTLNSWWFKRMWEFIQNSLMTFPHI